MATKTVKTDKAQPERNKSTFKSVQSVRKQLSKKTNRFFSISTMQAVELQKCKTVQNPKTDISKADSQKEMSEKKL